MLIQVNVTKNNENYMYFEGSAIILSTSNSNVLIISKFILIQTTNDDFFKDFQPI